ncbi:hypothetical protein [Brachyspira hyodysenteriae]|uniref:hypothetical protein n=1 Tax=Brachyspira hyodysenteriae TaxID=159 RepID=UPI00069CB0A1|nr:hypothetical protein [Brachyspira hyodysenteriae]
MPEKATIYKILISCPSDISEEIDIVKEVITNINMNFKKQHIRLESLYWKDDVKHEYGKRPQDIINHQIVKEADAIVAIFGDKLGSNTGKYDSGTIEEIEEIIKANKEVFLFFSDKNIPREYIKSSEKINEINKIEKFKRDYASRGIYSSYKYNDDFKREITKALNSYIISMIKIINSNLEEDHKEIIDKSNSFILFISSISFYWKLNIFIFIFFILLLLLHSFLKLDVLIVQIFSIFFGFIFFLNSAFMIIKKFTDEDK